MDGRVLDTSLMCFFNRGNTGGTSSLKILFDVCVFFVLYGFVPGLIFLVFGQLWFDDLCAA